MVRLFLAFLITVVLFQPICTICKQTVLVQSWSWIFRSFSKNCMKVNSVIDHIEEDSAANYELIKFLPNKTKFLCIIWCINHKCTLWTYKYVISVYIWLRRGVVRRTTALWFSKSLYMLWCCRHKTLIFGKNSITALLCSLILDPGFDRALLLWNFFHLSL